MWECFEEERKLLLLAAVFWDFGSGLDRKLNILNIFRQMFVFPRRLLQSHLKL